PQFELVRDAKFIDEIKRNLAVLDPLHGQSEQFVFRGRSDRVAGEPDVDMLSRQVPRPTTYVENDALYPIGLIHDFAYLGQPPLESTCRPRCRLNRRHISALSRGRRNRGSPTTPRIRADPFPLTGVCGPTWHFSKNRDAARATAPDRRAPTELATLRTGSR